MDEILYRRVLAALAATHAAATPHGVRVAAYGELEAFKARPDAIEYAFFLLDPASPHDDFCRHFALQCLEAAAASCGADPGPRGESLRTRAFDLLHNGVKPLGTEAGHIREAVARLVANLAERAYPQVWPGFFEGLLATWQGSADGNAADLAMLVLRNVAEDCTDAQFNARLSVGRRNDILRAMRPHVPALLALTFAFMAHHFGAAAATVAASGGAGDGGVSGALVNSALAMVRRFALWIRYEELLAPDHDFVAVCVHCVPHSCLRAEAAETLATLVARKLDRASLHGLLAMLPPACGATPAQTHATDDLPFWRTLARAANDAVASNATAIAEDAELLGSAQWATYLGLATGLITLPSLRLAADLHLLFFNIFRMRKARGAAARVLPAVLRSYWPKLVKPLGLEDGELDPIYEEEFASEEELVGFLGQFRGQVAGVLRAAAEALPLATAQAVGSVLDELLTAHGHTGTGAGVGAGAGVGGGTVPLDNVDSRGRATVRSTAYMQLDAYTHVLETALGALPKKSLRGDPALVGACAAIVQRLLAWPCRDPLLRCCQLNLLSATRSVLGGGSDGGGAGGGAHTVSADALHAAATGSDPSGVGLGAAAAAAAAAAMGALIPGVVDAFFAGMEAGEAWNAEPCPAATPVGEGVVLLRRRAGAALISLGKALPYQLAPHIGQLAGRVSAMSGRGTLREMQRMHCLEMLVAVSNALGDPAGRAEVVRQISAEAVAEWTSPEVTALVGSPAALLAHGLGVDMAPTSAGADAATAAAIHANVFRVTNSLNTLQSIARRVDLHVPAPGSPDAAAAAASAASAAAAMATVPRNLAFSGGAGAGGAGTGGGAAMAAQGVAGAVLPTHSSFAELWPVVLPNLLALIATLHGVWAPASVHALRGGGSLDAPATPAEAAHHRGGAAEAQGWGARAHVLGMAAQEVHLRSNLSGLTQTKSASVAGSEHAGLYDHHEARPDGITSGGEADAGLEEMRPRWLNELRTLAYALLGQCCSQGVLYRLPGAAEAACGAMLADLDHMEHRHFALMLKHAAEPFVLHCPVDRYASLFPPFLGPLLNHALQRCTVAWQHFSATDGGGAGSGGAGARDVGAGGGAAAAASPAALRAAEAHEWRTVAAAWRRDGGIVLGPTVDDATRELVIEKTRREVTRTLLGVLQAWLAIMGDLGKAYINYDGAKPTFGTGGGSSAVDPAGGGGRGNPSPKGTRGGGGDDGGGGDGDVGESGGGGASESMDAAHSHGIWNRTAGAAADAAAKRDKADALAHFLFLGDPAVAYPLAGVVNAALLWPDGQACTRALSLAHRMVGVCAGQPHYEPLLGTHLMHAAVFALVSSPKWLEGLEWDVLNLARDLYCLFAIGLASDKLCYAVASTRGAAGGRAETPPDPAVEAAAEAALRRQLSPVAGRPRAVLLSVGGVSAEAVSVLDRALVVTCTDTKGQKEALRELLLLASAEGLTTAAAGGAAAGGGLQRCRPPAILDLPQSPAFGGLRRVGSGAGIASPMGRDEALAGLSFLFTGGE